MHSQQQHSLRLAASGASARSSGIFQPYDSRSFASLSKRSKQPEPAAEVIASESVQDGGLEEGEDGVLQGESSASCKKKKMKKKKNMLSFGFQVAEGLCWC